MLPFVLCSLRSALNESSRETPYYLLFGQDIVLPIERAFNYTPSRYIETADLPFHEQLQSRLTVAWQQAKQHIEKAQQAQKRKHDRHSTPVDYKIGDLVLLFRPQAAYVELGRAAKLGKRWIGPYIITEVHPRNVLVKRQDVTDQQPFRVHMRRIKPFVTRLDDQTEDDSDNGHSDTNDLTTDTDGKISGSDPGSDPDEPETSSKQEEEDSSGRYNLRSRK